MDCVNHPGAAAAAYCQNCGKAMCATCMRQQGGQILCEPCSAAWQGAWTPLPPGTPNPSVAAVLGIIPGVGAMYNGQFVKGFIHVAIFAVLVTITSSVHSNLDIFFALLIPAWILYQAFEAYHTARARRDGDPVPDPLGLNELAGWFHTGIQAEFRRAQGFPPAPGAPHVAPLADQPAPPAGTGSVPPQSGFAPPYSAPHSNPYRSGYQPPPFTGAPGAAGFTAGGFGPAAGYGPGSRFGTDYPPIPPVPPMPQAMGRRPEPIAAIVLIAMGVLFLMGQFNWLPGRLFEFSWPLLLIGLGVWLFLRRMQEMTPVQPGFAPPPPAAAPPTTNQETQQRDSGQKSGEESQGGTL